MYCLNLNWEEMLLIEISLSTDGCAVVQYWLWNWFNLIGATSPCGPHYRRQRHAFPSHNPLYFHYPGLICCIYLAGGAGFSVQLLLSSHWSFWICLQFLLQNHHPSTQAKWAGSARWALAGSTFRWCSHIWDAAPVWWRQHICAGIPAPTWPKLLQELGMRDHSKNVPL